MQSFDYISAKLGVSPTLDPFLGMCRTLYADLRTVLRVACRSGHLKNVENSGQYECGG